MIIDTRICGIPAMVKVTYLHHSRLEPEERTLGQDIGIEMEYQVCDQHGRPAPWLERKMTDDDREELEQEIMTYE